MKNGEWVKFWILGKPTWIVGLWIFLAVTALIRMVVCRGFLFLVRVFIRSLMGDASGMALSPASFGITRSPIRSLTSANCALP